MLMVLHIHCDGMFVFVSWRTSLGPWKDFCYRMLHRSRSPHTRKQSLQVILINWRHARGLFILGDPAAVSRIGKNGGKNRRAGLFLKTLATVFPTQLTALVSPREGLIHWALGSAELTQKRSIISTIFPARHLQGVKWKVFQFAVC